MKVTNANFFQAIESLIDEVNEIKSRMNPRRTVGHIPEEPLMSMPMGLDEVCAMTERSRATIYRLTSRGEIPFYKNGNKLYFFRDEIIDWIKEGKKSVTRQRAAVSKPYTRKKKFVG